jgi:hypothetical protein
MVRRVFIKWGEVNTAVAHMPCDPLSASLSLSLSFTNKTPSGFFIALIIELYRIIFMSLFVCLSGVQRAEIRG